MPENQKDPGNEKLLILPLGEESRKITQVISNDTARHIIELLADAPLSASDIAQRLQAPLTTIAYNLENLKSVGLVKVERIKYSEKGREVKIYAPVRKLIVVVPEKTDRRSVADLLRKYLGVILAAVLASSLIEWFTKGADLMQNYDYSLKETPVPSPGVSQLPSITATTSHPRLNNSISSSLSITIILGLSESVNPSASTILQSVKCFSMISSISGLLFAFFITANFTDDVIATVSAPAFAYFHVSLHSISISKSPCLWYFRAPTLSPRAFSFEINSCMIINFILLLFPTMQITGGFIILRGVQG